MPVAEKDCDIGLRKEKKKQTKEERERLKQVEKKKRRLEKALATAAAIRIELEKKKQRRKEEEQRLDEEGAALAEAVALQVLVDEDSDLIEMLAENERTGDIVCEEGRNNVLRIVSLVEEGRKPGRSSDVPQLFSCLYPSVPDKNVHTGVTFNWEMSMRGSCRNTGSIGNNRCGRYAESQGPQRDWEDFSSTENKVKARATAADMDTGLATLQASVSLAQVRQSDWEAFRREDKVKSSNAKVKAAEMAAGVAASQAVAALRIAEEARAEAEAAKKAAEEAMSEVSDKNDSLDYNFGHQFHVLPTSIQIEMNELKKRLDKTEQQLKEKTRQVIHLEHNLESVSEYLFKLKAKLPCQDTSLEKAGETSGGDGSEFNESSCGTVDQ